MDISHGNYQMDLTHAMQELLIFLKVLRPRRTRNLQKPHIKVQPASESFFFLKKLI